MSTDQTIRVSAKGEFGQLRSGLKSLQGDLRSVTGEIDKSARKGGFFSDGSTEASFRALEVFSKRYKTSLDDINKELSIQDEVLKTLHRDMKAASGDQQKALAKELAQREQIVSTMRDQAAAAEKIYKRRMSEVGGLRSGDSGGGASDSSGSNMLSGGLANKLAKGSLKKLGAIGLAAATAVGIGSVISDSVKANYSREVDTLDLAQRIRGGSGRSTGSNVDLYREAQDVGIKDRMGYTGQETWQFLDAYTRMAGNVNTEDQGNMLKFGRGYGLASGETAGLFGANVHAGGGDPSELADEIANSVAKSGMTARVAEVMETNNTLLEQMNTTLKDGSAKQLMAYQTTLDKIGMEQGMKQLTGSGGADILGGLGGIYGSDASNPWKWIGIQALQQYNPDKYGNMGLYETESSFEDGLLNKDNLPAMADYIQKASGGNEDVSKRILQKWLTDGGFSATKTETSQLWEVTDGLKRFTEDQMNALKDGKVIGSGDKYDTERKEVLGQSYQDTEARYSKAIELMGQPFVETIQAMKTKLTEIAESLLSVSESFLGDSIGSGDIYNFLTGNWDKLAQESTLGMLASIFPKFNSLKDAAYKLFIDDTKEKEPDTPTKSDGIQFNTPEAKRNYDKQKEEDDKLDKNIKRATVLKEGAEIHEKYMAGDPLSKEENNKLLEYSDQLYADKKAQGDIKKPLIDKVADFLGGLFQWGGQTTAGVVTDQFRDKPTSKTPAVKKTEEDIASEKATKHTTVEEEGKAIHEKYLAGEKLTKEERAKLFEYSDQIYKDKNTKKETGTSADKGDSDIGFMPSLPTNTQLSTGTENKDKSAVEMGRASRSMSMNVADFTEDGLSNLVGMDKKTRDMADNAAHKYDTMVYHSSDMSTKSVSIFQLMYDKVANTMDSLYSEIKDLRGGLAGVTKTTGSGDVTQMSGVSSKELNSVLSGALSGKGSAYIAAGEKYGIDPGFLAAISMQETGGTSNALKTKNNVGGMMKRSGGLMEFESIEDGIMAMAENLKRNYIDKGLTTPEAIQKKYAPLQAKNDPDNLNSHWTKGVESYWAKLGGGSEVVSTAPRTTSSDSVFSNWQKKVTSEFGEKRTNSQHRGLDINGEQGDKLEALDSGTVSFVYMDDGGKQDADGKKNTRKGGTEVGITRADGSTYFYSHLSKVNENLKVGDKVNAGDYLGAMGGDPGAPGSGYSTTGSHLHLGYMDKNNGLLDPRDLLKSLNVGDSDLGYLDQRADTSTRELMSNAASSQVQKKSTPAPSEAVPTSKIQVELTINGSGASALNNATTSQLRTLVEKIVAENERLKLQLSPTRVGYSG